MGARYQELLVEQAVNDEVNHHRLKLLMLKNPEKFAELDWIFPKLARWMKLLRQAEHNVAVRHRLAAEADLAALSNTVGDSPPRTAVAAAAAAASNMLLPVATAPTSSAHASHSAFSEEQKASIMCSDIAPSKSLCNPGKKEPPAMTKLPRNAQEAAALGLLCVSSPTREALQLAGIELIRQAPGSSVYSVAASTTHSSTKKLKRSALTFSDESASKRKKH